MASDQGDSAESVPSADRLIGRRLGSYRLDAFLGAGGMGAVYRASDARLGRDVAVKVLPPEFAADPDRVRRFEQEARAVAALSHANILALYDVGTDDGLTFIVTELLHGRSLRDVLAGERVTMRRAVEFTTQLADGLAAAHARGIVHRDIKPDNIFITDDGVVKILDFGLAKSVTTSSDQSTRSATAPNVVLGTPGYMSPEQVRGQPSDHRADVFALGAVLYEMLCGQPAFKGGTASDLMSAILRDTPAPLVSSAQRPISPALARVVDRCLEKKPEARFESMRDLAFALKMLTDVGSSVAVEAGSAARPRSGWRWIAVSIGLVAIAGAAVWLWRGGRDEPRPVQGFSWALGDAQLSGVIDPFALTPDDSALVYAGQARGARSSGPGSPGVLFRRPISTLEATPIPGTEGMSSVFFSPDGKWMGFVPAPSGRRILKQPVSGGAPIEVASSETGSIQGASWTQDDQIVFARGDLWRVASTNGKPELIEPKPPQGLIVWPQALERGMILYTTFSGDTSRGDAPEAVLRLPDGSKRTLATDAIHAQYVAPGYLVFGRGASIMAAKLDLRRPEAMSVPVAVKDGVYGSRRWEQFYSRFSVSARGSLAYAPGRLVPVASQTISWIDRVGGEETPWPFGPLTSTSYRLSPDGALVAFAARDPDSFAPTYQLWIGDLSRGTKQKLGESVAYSPVWTRDGKVVYGKRDGSLWIRPADLSAPERRIGEPGPSIGSLDISPDGKTVVRTKVSNQVTMLFLMTGFAEGAGQERVFRDDAMTRREPRFSPDGKWLAYVAESRTASGATRRTLQVEPFPGPGPVVVVSVDPIPQGSQGTPAWRGNELLWQSQPGHVMGVTYTTTPTFKPSAPRLIMKKPADASFAGSETSIDGRRLLIYRREPTPPPPTQINIVLNWVEELKQRIK